MKIIINNDISDDLERLVRKIGERKFKTIISDIERFYQGKHNLSENIVLIESAENQAYFYKIDYQTRLVFTKVTKEDEDLIFIVELFKKM